MSILTDVSEKPHDGNRPDPADDAGNFDRNFHICSQCRSQSSSRSTGQLQESGCASPCSGISAIWRRVQSSPRALPSGV